MNRGMVFGVGAYVVWGVLPVFWKALESVDALEILAHRLVWSVVFLALVVTLRSGWQQITELGGRTIARLLFAGLLLGINWGVYIWAVNSDHIVESSLGYFINPLLNVVLGVLILRERLDPLQWVAVAIAASGVTFMTVRLGSLPWIALVLAGTFGFYALLKKQLDTVGPLQSLTVEVSLLLLPALGFIVIAGVGGSGSFVAAGPRTTLLLVLTGVATAVPLLLFGAAARRIKLATIGILQYIAPSLQFLLGVFLYNEGVTGDELVGFVLVWLALAIFTTHGILATRQQRLVPA